MGEGKEKRKRERKRTWLQIRPFFGNILLLMQQQRPQKTARLKGTKINNQTKDHKNKWTLPLTQIPPPFLLPLTPPLPFPTCFLPISLYYTLLHMKSTPIDIHRENKIISKGGERERRGGERKGMREGRDGRGERGEGEGMRREGEGSVYLPSSWPLSTVKTSNKKSEKTSGICFKKSLQLFFDCSAVW